MISKMEKLQTFNVNIEGYWRDKNKKGIPSYSGIFFVYNCKYNTEVDTVTLILIIYIGEADNINDRIDKHERYDQWKSFLRDGDELCFSAAYISVANRTRVKAAFINKIKPLANKDYKDEFPFEETTIQSTGKTKLLDTIFTVKGVE